jgi:hypothetical protein
VLLLLLHLDINKVFHSPTDPNQLKTILKYIGVINSVVMWLQPHHHRIK